MPNANGYSCYTILRFGRNDANVSGDGALFICSLTALTVGYAGTLPDNQGQETLYFDSQSGLPVRRVTALRTALGGIPQQYDYSDYPDVNGVKIPL